MLRLIGTIICYNAGISPEDHFKFQASNDGYHDQLRFDIRRYIETLQDGESEVNVATKDFITKRKERIKGTKSLPDGTSMENESGPIIVVCLDEARPLLDDEKRDAPSCLFRAFRQVVNELFDEELPNDLARDFHPFQSAVETALTPNYSMFCVLLAASRHMRTPREKLECVHAVLPAFFRGSIDIGDSGEIMAAMILLMTIDSMINTLKPSTVTVGQFLHALLGKKPAEQMKSEADEYDRLAEIWDKGTVYFNHFFRPLTEMTPSVTNKYPNQLYQRGVQAGRSSLFPGKPPGRGHRHTR